MLNATHLSIMAVGTDIAADNKGPWIKIGQDLELTGL